VNDDPFVSLFWNKKVKHMIEKYDYDSTKADTVTFDTNGNIIERNGPSGVGRYLYDKNHLMVRLLYLYELSENDVITYNFDEERNALIKFSYPIYKHNKLDYVSSDLDSANVDVTTILFDKANKIINTSGPNEKTGFNYFYRNGSLFQAVFSRW
jgi:hypothetical protein